MLRVGGRNGSNIGSGSLRSRLVFIDETWTTRDIIRREENSPHSPHAANASLNARSPGAPFSIAMMARRWLE